MDARHASWLEAAVDSTAAAILAGAVGYAASRFHSSTAMTGALAATAMLGGLRVLRLVGPVSPRFALHEFDLAPLPEVAVAGELILTETDRLDRAGSEGAEDELVLDDVISRLEDLSRVVRLFDRSAMPTPGELQGRIDRHLERPRPETPTDASQALHDALSELRRSLR